MAAGRARTHCDHDIGLAGRGASKARLKTIMPFEFLSLSGSLTRAHALESLLAASTLDHEDAELCINATMVERVDVVAATATRMRLARHQREHPTGHVSIWLPRRSATAARYADMLSPLPDARRLRAAVPEHAGADALHTRAGNADP